MLKQIFYYQNTQGQLVDFTAAPFGWAGTEPLDFEWTPTVKSNPFTHGSRLIRMSKQHRTFTIKVIASGTWADITTAMNNLAAVAEVDTLAGIQGTLLLGTQSIKCNIISCETDEYIGGLHTSFNLTFFALYPFWTTEMLNSYPAFTSGAETGFILPTALPLSIGITFGTSRIVNDHYAPCQAVITIFGPCIDPSFTVGAHVYAVEGTLGDGERYVIDQRDNTVVKITQPGEIINAFQYRGKTDSVFEPIPVGDSLVYYTGDFAIDILLLKERSVPTWS